MRRRFGRPHIVCCTIKRTRRIACKKRSWPPSNWRSVSACATFAACCCVWRRRDRSTACASARGERAGKSECEDWQQLASAEPGPDSEAQSCELAARLRAAIGQLPAQEAKVFCLRHFNELSYRQIAKELQITTGAAGVLLHRAKTKLRELLAPVEEETRLPYGT